MPLAQGPDRVRLLLSRGLVRQARADPQQQRVRLRQLSFGSISCEPTDRQTIQTLDTARTAIEAYVSTFSLGTPFTSPSMVHGKEFLGLNSFHYLTKALLVLPSKNSMFLTQPEPFQACLSKKAKCKPEVKMKAAFLVRPVHARRDLWTLLSRSTPWAAASRLWMVCCKVRVHSTG